MSRMFGRRFRVGAGMEEVASSWLDQELCEGVSFSVSSKQRQALTGLGVHTVGDLLLLLPRRYEDRRQFETFPNQPMDRAVCLHGVVTDTKARFAGRRRFVEATIESVDPGPFEAPLVCRWFQMPWMSKALAVGRELVLYGKPKQSGARLVMDHPEIEWVDEGAASGVQESVHMGRIVPVYPLSSGLKQRDLRAWLHALCQRVGQDREAIPNILHGAWADMERWRALQEVHFPESMGQADAAKRYLAKEEFLQLQVTVLSRREEYRRLQGVNHCGSGELLDRFLDSLAWEPTGAQQRAVAEIRADLAATIPMNRLLQGDVGAGKTLVAVAAMLLAVEAGYQAVLMAPTQILAEQHYRGIVNWLGPLGVRIGLRTADRSDDSFLPLLDGGEDAQILVGTHALLYEKVEIGDRLGLIVVDEQHKFGVLQRGKLLRRAESPDVLVMTATPIPRTLSMTLYGDLDVSVLDELPKGRGKVITAVRPMDKTPDAAHFLQEQIGHGRQAYIVYPLVEESEKLKLGNAIQAFDEWRDRLGAEVEVGLLHGRLSPEDKDGVMNQFRANKVQVLVATTVIEVGVDVPNATVMFIYHAERFGLAQLHQLRGRIGRGEHKSYCVLMHAPGSEEAAEKLAVLAETRDGFKIAEADLGRRGPGDILGTAQSGLPNLRLTEFLADTELLSEARAEARAILQRDPQLREKENAGLRAAVDRYGGDVVNVG